MVLCGALGPDLSPGAPRHFAWQAWHLVTSTFVSRGRRGTKLASTVVLRGRRGTHGTGWRAWSGFVACDAAALCVAGVALGDIHLRFTWPGVYAWTGLTLACSQREKVGALQLHLSCMHTYIHTYIPTVLPSRSFTTSFVFPSFSDPATTFETHYWKKLTCGVIYPVL